MNRRAGILFLVILFAAEITAQQAFRIVHTTDDGAVPVENSIQFYLALREHGVPAEMHLYEQGGHGYGLATGKGDLASWLDRLEAWLQRRGLAEGME